MALRLKTWHRELVGNTTYDRYRECQCDVFTGMLVVCSLLLVWFRMSMNYDSQPVFKPYEMRAAFHPDRDVRQVTCTSLTFTTHCQENNSVYIEC